MINKIQNSAHGTDIANPSMILATATLTLIGALLGAISYLSYQYMSADDRALFDAGIGTQVPSQDIKTDVSEKQNITEWKTYKNDHYGFSFRYPADWKITRDPFSENFIVVATNKTYTSDTSGEIRIESLNEEGLADEDGRKADPQPDDKVYGFETTFSHMIDLAGKQRKEYLRFHYLELGSDGKKIPKDDWKYFDTYKKITDSFAFIR